MAGTNSPAVFPGARASIGSSPAAATSTNLTTGALSDPRSAVDEHLEEQRGAAQKLTPGIESAKAVLTRFEQLEKEKKMPADNEKLKLPDDDLRKWRLALATAQIIREGGAFNPADIVKADESAGGKLMYEANRPQYYQSTGVAQGRNGRLQETGFTFPKREQALEWIARNTAAKYPDATPEQIARFTVDANTKANELYDGVQPRPRSGLFTINGTSPGRALAGYQDAFKGQEEHFPGSKQAFEEEVGRLNSLGYQRSQPQYQQPQQYQTPPQPEHHPGNGRTTIRVKLF